MKLLIPSFLIVIMVTYFCYRITKSSDHAESVISAQQASMVAGLAADEAPTHVIVDGDEMPGIGAGVERPDTALVYFNQKDRRTHIKYLAPAVK